MGGQRAGLRIGFDAEGSAVPDGGVLGVAGELSGYRSLTPPTSVIRRNYLAFLGFAAALCY